jgi:hypothetical protein
LKSQYIWTTNQYTNTEIGIGDDKYLAFLTLPTGGLHQNKQMFLEWVKEVRTTKSLVYGAEREICRGNNFC